MQNQSDFERKYAKAIEELSNKTHLSSRYGHRAIDKFRVQLGLRPPYYNSFRSNFLWSALFMSLVMVISGWIAGWSTDWSFWQTMYPPSLTISILSLVAGVVMGLWLALHTRFFAQNHSLSRWSDL
ncbi:MAG: hypothetical protein KTR29_18205 [Rhodothermaceae bacterium]|nr:hypothetical protein [Rhodothermaceae bacterium]